MRKGYAQECPNIGKLLQNLEFTLPWRTRSWAQILDDGQGARRRGHGLAEGQPDGRSTPGSPGVTTVDGGDGLAAVKAGSSAL